MPMEWRDEHEDLLRQWITQAYYERMMHSHASVFYTKFYHWGGCISVCLSAITTAGIFVEFGTQFGGTVWGFLVLAILSLMATVSSTVIQFLNPLSLATAHNRAENLYNTFTVDANSVVVCPRCDRESCQVYMARAKTTLQLLPLACPVIPTHISKLYIKKVTHKRQALDEIVIAGDNPISVDQTDIEDALHGESTQPGNNALHEFLAEKSNIL